MAVSLAHMSQEASRRRATTLPSSLAHPPPPMYNPNEMSANMAGQGFLHCYVPTPAEQQQQFSGAPSTAPIYPAANEPWVGIPDNPMGLAQHQQYSYQAGNEFSPQSATYRPLPPPLPPKELEESERPALPPRPGAHQKPQEQPPSPHDSVHSHSSSSADSAPSFRTSIEPDPLPPHSNPQALSKTQSAAFTASNPIPDLSVGHDEIWSTATGLADYRIIREAAHLPRKLSSKPLLTVTRTSDGQTIGSIKLHTFTSNSIDITLPSGRSTTLSHGALRQSRWGWEALSSKNAWEQWYWKAGGAEGLMVLENHKHKHGEALARLDGEKLVFVRPRMREEEREEIVLSAVAVMEAGRRARGER